MGILVEDFDEQDVEGEEKLILKSLQDQVGRFKIWAGNLGVFADGHCSADYRLRYGPDIKDIIVKKPYPAHVEQPEEDSDSIYSTDSSLEISDDASSQEQEWIGDPIPKNPVLEKVNHTITHLYRITAIIKKPHSSKEEDRFRASIARQGTEMAEQLQNLESYVSWPIGRRLLREEQSSILAVEI
ncbi:hypothetical protein SLS55_001892 [Diplodia seriata]|uniref:Uncharacterized protein n=1 Tax=Diplodia seriata TaxID=420778 RepID=A0ABR3CQL1_9PEZI